MLKAQKINRNQEKNVFFTNIETTMEHTTEPKNGIAVITHTALNGHSLPV